MFTFVCHDEQFLSLSTLSHYKRHIHTVIRNPNTLILNSCTCSILLSWTNYFIVKTTTLRQYKQIVCVTKTQFMDVIFGTMNRSLFELIASHSATTNSSSLFITWKSFLWIRKQFFGMWSMVRTNISFFSFTKLRSIWVTAGMRPQTEFWLVSFVEQFVPFSF